MAQSTRTPRRSAKKRAPARKKKTSGWFPEISLSTILYYLAVLVLFLFSLGVLFYVIFFQVVVAAEATEYESVPGTALIVDDRNINLEVRSRPDRR